MAHVGIFGPTMSGKTTLAQHLAREMLRQGVAVLVLDPFGERWPCTWQTDDRARFLTKAKSSRRCALFLDEAGATVAREDDAEWLFTRSRHWGHRLHCIGQSGTQLTPLMRGQISTLFLFRASRRVAELWAEEFAVDGIASAVDLSQFEFLRATRFPPAVVRSRLALRRV